MKVAYHPDYYVPIPESHPFPMRKYPELFERLRITGLLDAGDVVEPVEADWQDILLAHTSEYIGALASYALDRQQERRLGLPWTPALMRRSRLAAQGTIVAAEQSLADGIAANLSGGTHHSFAGHGEGYCVLNDVAIAIRLLQARGRAHRALVVDLDVHQGNGTAAIFSGDESVFTLSAHGARNYPLRKMESSLDIPLEDGCTDGGYLDAVERPLAKAFERFRPDIVFYLAGVDVAIGDRLGRLALTDRGIAERDRMVLELTHRRGCPVAMVLAGGYAETPAETARLHAIAHEVAHSIYRPRPGTAAAL